MNIFLIGEQIRDFGFFSNTNWKNFSLGDEVFVEDCETAVFSGVEFVVFEQVHGNNVFLMTVESFDNWLNRKSEPSDNVEQYLPASEVNHE